MKRKIGEITGLTLTMCGSMVFAGDEGHWDLLTDFVYMERYHVKDQTIAVRTPRCANCADKPTLNVKDLASGFGFEPGFHVALSYMQDPRSSYEAGFVYLWEWENTKTVTSKISNLSFPFNRDSFAPSFLELDKLEAFYSSKFYTAELNYAKAFSESRHSYLSLSGIAGLRFAHLGERFSITAFSGSNFGEYDIKTHNDLIGIQLGFAFQINAMKGLHWDLDGKVGVGLNRIDVKTYLADQNRTVELRNFTKQDWQQNIFAEVSVGTGYRVLPYLDLHAGYDMLYFCGLALAPDQIDTTVRTATLNINNNGYVIVHGIFVGCTFSF